VRRTLQSQWARAQLAAASPCQRPWLFPSRQHYGCSAAGWLRGGGNAFRPGARPLLGALGLQRSKEALLARINGFIPVPFLAF